MTFHTIRPSPALSPRLGPPLAPCPPPFCGRRTLEMGCPQLGDLPPLLPPSTSGPCDSIHCPRPRKLGPIFFSHQDSRSPFSVGHSRQGTNSRRQRVCGKNSSQSRPPPDRCELHCLSRFSLTIDRDNSTASSTHSNQLSSTDRRRFCGRKATLKLSAWWTACLSGYRRRTVSRGTSLFLSHCLCIASLAHPPLSGLRSPKRPTSTTPYTIRPVADDLRPLEPLLVIQPGAQRGRAGSGSFPNGSAKCRAHRGLRVRWPTCRPSDLPVRPSPVSRDEETMPISWSSESLTRAPVMNRSRPTSR